MRTSSAVLISVVFNIATICARRILITEQLQVQFAAPFTSSPYFDSEKESYLIAEGSSIALKCQSKTTSTPCSRSNIYHNDSPVVVNDELVANNSRYFYSSLLSAFKFLHIQNSTYQDSGEYACVCRAPASTRTLFLSTRSEPELSYSSSLNVTVVTNLPEVQCISSSSDVIVDEVVHLKCVGNDTILALQGSTNPLSISSQYEEETIEINTTSIIFRASERMNNKFFCCLGQRRQEVCSFRPINVHRKLQTTAVIVSSIKENFVSFECSAVPRVENVTWEVFLNDSRSTGRQSPLEISVINDGRKSLLTIPHFPANSTGTRIICTTTLNNQTSVAMVLLDQVDILPTVSDILSTDDGSNGSLDSEGFPFLYAMFMALLACSLLLTLFVFLVTVKYYRPDKQTGKESTGAHWDRESVFTIATAVDENGQVMDDITTGSNIRQDCEITNTNTDENINVETGELLNIKTGQREIRSNFEDASGLMSVSSTSRPEDGGDNDNDDCHDSSKNDGGGSQSLWILNSNGRVTPKARHKSLQKGLYHPSGESSEIKKKVRFASQSVIVRSSSRRSSLFDEDVDSNDIDTSQPNKSISRLFQPLPLNKIVRHDIGDYEDIGEWMKSRSHDHLSTSPSPIPISDEDSKDDFESKQEDSSRNEARAAVETEPIYAIPDKLRKKRKLIPPQSVGDAGTVKPFVYVHKSGSIMEINRYPRDSSPNVNRLRLNKWRGKVDTSEA